MMEEHAARWSQRDATRLAFEKPCADETPRATQEMRRLAAAALFLLQLIEELLSVARVTDVVIFKGKHFACRANHE